MVISILSYFEIYEKIRKRFWIVGCNLFDGYSGCSDTRRCVQCYWHCVCDIEYCTGS